jgi:alkylation response protein AidB-like acyl-CoA dehydrogenase
MISRYGTDEHRRVWLPRMASGETKVVFAITEPDAGSNTHKIRTPRSRTAATTYSTAPSTTFGGRRGRAVIVVARTASDKLSLFLVPTDAPASSRTTCRSASACRRNSSPCIFDNVRVPTSALVGTEHEGFRQVFDGLNPERITGAAVCVGVGRHTIDKAAEYARTRSVWGPAIGSYQAISHPLALSRIELELAAMMTAKAAWLYDNGTPRPKHRTWRSTPPPRPRSRRPTTPSKPTAATGCPPSSAAPPMGSGPPAAHPPRSAAR